MSMMYDVSNTVISFCKEHELEKYDSYALLEALIMNLEWDFGETEEDTKKMIAYYIDRSWE